MSYRISGDSFIIKMLSVVFLLAVIAFTTLTDYRGAIIYLIYLVIALPFYKHLDKFVILCFVISTLGDYFVGGNVDIYSVYSILIILIFIRMICNPHIKVVNILPFIALIIVAVISCNLSKFGYTNGVLTLAYKIGLAAIIAVTVEFEKDTVENYMPMMAGIMVLFYLFVIVNGGFFNNGFISVSEETNHNSLGKSIAQLAVILVYRLLIVEKKSVIYQVFGVLSFILTLASGSRNAVLALLATSIFIYGYRERNRGNKLSWLVKTGIVVVAVLTIASTIIPYTDFDLGRFDFIELVKSGGTNRVTIWIAVIPVIVQNYFWFGYGPGYYCSSQIVTSLVHRNYTHTHNIFVEAFGEVGVLGLATFVFILIKAIQNIRRRTKNDISQLVFLALLIDLIVNGIGEAMFYGINLWLVIGMCYIKAPKNQRDIMKNG